MGKSNPERQCSPPRLFLQVRAGRRKCVSSAALCTQRYRTHRQGETGWRERGSVVQRGRERMGGPWFRAGGRGEGDICPAVLQPHSVAGQDEKCQSRAAGESNVNVLLVSNQNRKLERKWGWQSDIIREEWAQVHDHVKEEAINRWIRHAWERRVKKTGVAR